MPLLSITEITSFEFEWIIRLIFLNISAESSFVLFRASNVSFWVSIGVCIEVGVIQQNSNTCGKMNGFKKLVVVVHYYFINPKIRMIWSLWHDTVIILYCNHINICIELALLSVECYIHRCNKSVLSRMCVFFPSHSYRYTYTITTFARD